MQKIDLTKGKVTKVLLATAIPIMGSSLLQFTYNLVDMLFVGRLGSDAVASVGSSSFFIGLGYSINAIVVIGTGIKVAHSIGNSDEIKTKGYINSGLILNFIIGLIYSLLLVLLGKELISFLDLGNLRVERDGYIYLALSAPMLFFAFFNLLYTRILSSYGNNKIGTKVGVLVWGAAPSGWMKVGGRLGTPGPGQAQLGLWLTETEGKCRSHRLSCS